MFVRQKRISNMVLEWGFSCRGSHKARVSPTRCQAGMKSRTTERKGQSVTSCWHNALNWPLWWFMVPLLVTCAFTNQTSESQLLMGPKYAVKKDRRYWGISRTWLYISWGTAKGPILQVEQDVLEPEPACDTIHCYAHKGVDLGFQTLGLFLDNPISLWTESMKFPSIALIAKFSLIWKVSRIICIIVLLNMMAFIYMQVADVFVLIWKLFMWIYGWPLFPWF